MKRNISFSLEQLEPHLDKGVAALDQVRATQIADGLRLESAKGAVQVREHERLRKKYGDQHPRARAMAERARVSREYRAELVTEYRNAATPRPQAGAGWGVDGFVRTVEGAPVTRVTVAAADRQGRWLEGFGHACTNEQGYFNLIVDKLPEQETRVYLRAFDRGKALDSNENRLAPAAGRSERIEIIVERSTKGDCMPPEGRAPASPGPPSAPPPEPPKPAVKAAEPAASEAAPQVKAAARAPAKAPAKARAKARAKATVAKPTRAQTRSKKRRPGK